MPNFGPTELIIILFIAILLFGVGRLGRLGGELGRGIREFRQGLQDDDAEKLGEDSPPESSNADSEGDESEE